MSNSGVDVGLCIRTYIRPQTPVELRKWVSEQPPSSSLLDFYIPMLNDSDISLMNSFSYNAFGKDFTGDAVNVKADERVPPLFMLPPMYNGYTSYTCPILEGEPASSPINIRYSS